MDNQNRPPEREETAEEKRLRYLTDEERREWSGISEWHDPLDKPPEAPPDARGDRLAIAATALGIGSVMMGCIHISSLALGIAAVVCGILAKKKYGSVSRLATAGIVLGCICFGMFLAREILWVMGRLFPPEGVQDTLIPGDLASELES